MWDRVKINTMEFVYVVKTYCTVHATNYNNLSVMYCYRFLITMDLYGTEREDILTFVYIVCDQRVFFTLPSLRQCKEHPLASSRML